MSTNQALQPRPLAHPLSGFRVLLGRESRKWLRTRRWWMQALLWLVLLNGFAAFSLFVLPDVIEQTTAASAGAEANTVTAAELREDVPNTLFGLATFLLPIGVILLVQNQVYGEKQSGVSAWIISKPVSRATYLLAKLVTDGSAILLLMILLPLIPAYFILSSTIAVSVADFALALLLLALLLAFYLAFTTMMSVIGSSAEVVMGVALALLVGGMILSDVLASFLGNAAFLLPWMLPDAITLAAAGVPLPPVLVMTIVSTAVLTLLCLGIAFWQFGRQEL